jgi:hypothetical protein
MPGKEVEPLSVDPNDDWFAEPSSAGEPATMLVSEKSPTKIIEDSLKARQDGSDSPHISNPQSSTIDVEKPRGIQNNK